MNEAAGIFDVLTTLELYNNICGQCMHDIVEGSKIYYEGMFRIIVRAVFLHLQFFLCFLLLTSGIFVCCPTWLVCHDINQSSDWLVQHLLNGLRWDLYWCVFYCIGSFIIMGQYWCSLFQHLFSETGLGQIHSVRLSIIRLNAFAVYCISSLVMVMIRSFWWYPLISFSVRLV